jgi:hypothetical protein
MKLIKPAEISAKIMTLIDEADKQLIIVSPYNNISGWNKLLIRIKKAQSHGVNISWYSRKNNVEKNNSEEVRAVGIEPVLIDDLHAKIYMNEEHAILTSMNMSKTSDEKSIDLGYITETKDEYDELYNTFLKHIKSKTNNINTKEQKVITPKITTPNEKQNHKIDTDEYYVRVIHEYINKNYGLFNYNYKKESVLEYFDFIMPGYKIQFLPYSQAIRIHIYLPQNITIEKIEDKVSWNKEYKKLHKKSELEFCSDNGQEYVKYYFEQYNKKLSIWGMDLVYEFLNNLDILIKIIYK